MVFVGFGFNTIHTGGGAELHTDTWNTSTAAGDNWDSETGVDLSVVTDVYYSP